MESILDRIYRIYRINRICRKGGEEKAETGDWRPETGKEGASNW